MALETLIQRSEQLARETRLDSITPDRIGSILVDTLLYINTYQLLASSPLIHKLYSSRQTMYEDESPISDVTGRQLFSGQLVAISSEDTDDTGSVYRFNGDSSWSYVSKIGGVPADSELSHESTNPLQNKVITEYIKKLYAEKFGYSLIAGNKLQFFADKKSADLYASSPITNAELLLHEVQLPSSSPTGGGSSGDSGSIDPELLEGLMPLAREFSDDFNDDFSR